LRSGVVVTAYWVVVDTIRKVILRKSIVKIIFLVAVGLGSSFVGFGQNSNKSKKVIVEDTTSQLVRINKVFILGNDKTKRYIIMRELRFKEGDYIEKRNLDEILRLSRNNVYNTNLFHSVDLQKLELDSGSIDIFIKVEERWYVWPSFTLKPVDRNLVDWWKNYGHSINRVRLGPKLDVYNVGGRKESLRIIGLFGFDKRFIGQYTIPYLDKGRKHGVTLGGSYIESKKLDYQNIDHIKTYINDTISIVNQTNRWVRRGYIEYRFRPSFNDYHFFTIDAYSMNISQGLANLNPNYYGNGRTSQKVVELVYTFVKNRKNNRNYPLTGYYILGQFDKKGIGLFKDLNMFQATINLQYYHQVAENVFFSTSLAGQVSTTKNVPYFNRTEFGEGTYYVRGFERYVIQGPINFLNRNSLKYRLVDTQFHLSDKVMPLKKFRKIPFRLYPKVFFDLGYVKNYPNNPMSSFLTNKPIYSMGFGFDIVGLYDVTLRLETSYNSQREFRFAPNFMAEFALH